MADNDVSLAIRWTQEAAQIPAEAEGRLERLGGALQRLEAREPTMALRETRFAIASLAAAAVPVVTGDKLMILLSFTNNDPLNPQTFSWIPQGTVTFDSWLPDRGLEMILGSKKRKPRPAEDHVVLLLGDDEPWE